MRVTLERLVSAVNRLAQAIEALIRLELLADRPRQEATDATD